MPKVKPTEPITKKQLSRREQERRQQRILGIVFGLTAAAVLFVLGFGWYQEYVAKPSAPVATVNGKAISTRDYQAMVKYNDYELRSTIARAQSQLDSLDATNEDQTFLVSYMQQQIQQLRTKRSSVGLDTYDQMVDDELIRQEAARRGIQITAEDVAAFEPAGEAIIGPLEQQVLALVNAARAEHLPKWLGPRGVDQG